MYLGFGEFIYLLFIIYDGEKPCQLKKPINPSKVFSQEEETRVVFCVLQHYCIKFEFISLVRVIVYSFDVQWHS